jgi:hypothetical protein
MRFTTKQLEVVAFLEKIRELAPAGSAPAGI